MFSNSQITNDPLRIAEHNDCAVVALANACDISYPDAHQILAQQGRKPRHGTYTSAVRKAMDTLQSLSRIANWKEVSILRPGWNLGQYNRETAAQFIRRMPRTGRFILMAGGHAFAFIDGEVRDNLRQSKMRARMMFAFEIKLTTPQPPQPDLTQTDISAMWERLNRIEGRL